MSDKIKYLEGRMDGRRGGQEKSQRGRREIIKEMKGRGWRKRKKQERKKRRRMTKRERRMKRQRGRRAKDSSSPSSPCVSAAAFW